MQGRQAVDLADRNICYLYINAMRRMEMKLETRLEQKRETSKSQDFVSDRAENGELVNLKAGYSIGSRIWIRWATLPQGKISKKIFIS
jgi:hypothetical protein